MPAPRKPAGQKVTRHEVAVPEQVAPGVGWRFGDRPSPPDGLLDESLEAWDAWFASWWASLWTEADVPGLRTTARAFDDHLRGNVKLTALLPLLEQYGITPKGRKVLAWVQPKESAAPAGAEGGARRLRVVDSA